ncbi:MAG: hypothetical protein U0T84_11940 [Chitinophagales bacterium]
MGKYIAIAAAVIALILGGIFFYTQYTYSEGNRAGLLIKFSNKGYLFKTFEGELNLGGVNTDPKAGLVNNVWNFSVTNRAVADSLMHLEGKYIRLHYKQIIHNFSWQGETPYFVDAVEEVQK